MKRNWGEVLDICSLDSKVHASKITRSGDTILHIAVADNQEDIVGQLAGFSGNKEALKIGNEQGNTPLHVAASMGSVRMCECIANVDPKLVGARNQDGETPFFLTALHGKKDAFLCLHGKCSDGEGESYSRRVNNGDTILHCAIAGDYFDLGYQIIRLYKFLVNYVNKQGFTPLHLLATKPSAFRSGSHLSFNRIIYHCIFVDELREETSLKTSEDEKIPYCLDTSKYPVNYHGCIDFIQLLWNMIRGD
ncbi:hypothetical protein L1049_015402 [Liquidambar formosana]|uniref:Uncharacterized protein n=1 Tax=Liquidambar formosana TaxID=63359 RepID=A0AAP0RYT3_LIQFO